MSPDINPLGFLWPVISIIIGIVPVIMLRVRARIFGVAAISYFIAIALKIIIQNFTLNYIILYPYYVQGLYYGVQTAILEAGFSFIFAIMFKIDKPLEFGVSLAFWENAIFLGFLSGITLPEVSISYYLIASNAPGSKIIYESLKNTLLYFGNYQLLRYLFYHTLDRLSSLFAHGAWGAMASLYFIKRKKSYFIIMLLGLIDFLVPLFYDHIIDYFDISVLSFLFSIIGFLSMYLVYQKYMKNKVVN
ncbi:hypothetical protein [Picrophilus oshimae]|uniref:Hypothetical transporter n=1 Tax=Picrophilus torridus (strain ATCC 700027 / DSM 9790 / JCM 10055 / NBRC 100828 / KAW 2/3) TaxID=1122961 RepID=Q6L1X0_PICTO|nr:hypothetical protein [Picrophilus oshimae]AAT43032.1 hypothetical transporter [Picrophilus oshimae DSM 9789]